MAQAPAVGPLPTIALPPAKRFALSNGLEVVALRRDVAPIVSAAFMFRSGAACDPAGRAGLASIAAEMLDEGAGPRDALGIAAELEQLGADLWLGSGRDGSQLSIQAPRETFAAAMAIAADVLIRPRLEQGDLQRVHNDRRTGVVQRRDPPGAVVNVAADRILFGDGHPYGQPVDGLERTIDAITLDDVRAFHAAHYHPGNASLVVAGDVDEATLPPQLEALLAAWKAAPAPATPRPLPWPTRPRLVIIDRSGAPQSIVRLVAPGTGRFSPDRPGLSMRTAIRGGSFPSRLNFNLREKNGYTYGAASSFSFLRQAGAFAARSAVFAESTAPAVREMLSELSGLRERPITAEEHAKANATLLMRVAEGLATTGGMASTFGELGLYGLPLDEPMRFVGALQRTTAEDLRGFAERYVDPEAVCIVIVGDRAAIEPGLREIGLPAAILYSADGDQLA